MVIGIWRISVQLQKLTSEKSWLKSEAVRVADLVPLSSDCDLLLEIMAL